MPALVVYLAVSFDASAFLCFKTPKHILSLLWFKTPKHILSLVFHAGAGACVAVCSGKARVASISYARTRRPHDVRPCRSERPFPAPDSGCFAHGFLHSPVSACDERCRASTMTNERKRIATARPKSELRRAIIARPLSTPVQMAWDRMTQTNGAISARVTRKRPSDSSKCIHESLDFPNLCRNVLVPLLLAPYDRRRQRIDQHV